MATWDDISRLALELPETSEGVSRDLRRWLVKDKGFVWERPLRRADYEALGDAAPDGPILGAGRTGSGLLLANEATEPGIHALATDRETSLRLQRGADSNVLVP